MKKYNMNNNSKLSLLGYGQTLKALAQKVDSCNIYDDKFENENVDEFGNKLLPSSQFEPSCSDLEIVTPGIPPHHELVKKAKNVISDYDFFSNVMPFSVWISGTNGKTTTTKMIHHLLGENLSDMGGNVGNPVANMDINKKIWVLETSSFTCHYTNKAKPNIYILLPISEDHISWHGSFESYENAKLKPLKMMHEGDIAIVPSKYASLQSSAFLIPYDNSEDLAQYFDIDAKKINFKEPFLIDALLACSIQKILFDKVDYDLINNFILEEHKMEELVDSKGRVWINDSKATNVDATIWALKSFKNKKINLILGGDDKDANLTPLFEELKNYNIELFTIGKNEQKLTTLAKQYDIKSHPCQTLENAVSKIESLSPSHYPLVTILSPAAASLDQFTSYKHRGNTFKDLVKSL
jgi:UDP-N-acetylmuramoylalanine--D-glutamate ligase